MGVLPDCVLPSLWPGHLGLGLLRILLSYLGLAQRGLLFVRQSIHIHEFLVAWESVNQVLSSLVHEFVGQAVCRANDRAALLARASIVDTIYLA
jgi:hypothetical protein